MTFGHPHAAQRAKRDPAFAASYATIAHRRGRGIATTAIARTLLARAFHLLTEHAKTTADADHAVDKAATTPTGQPRRPAGMVTSTGRARKTA